MRYLCLVLILVCAGCDSAPMPSPTAVEITEAATHYDGDRGYIVVHVDHANAATVYVQFNNFMMASAAARSGHAQRIEWTRVQGVPPDPTREWYVAHLLASDDTVIARDTFRIDARYRDQ